MFYGAPGIGFENAQRLRSEMTEAENTLWLRLCKKQLLGQRFRRQHPMANYIADFYCHKAKLVVEVDGLYHSSTEQLQYDLIRTSELNDLGIKVLRFTNHEVLHDIEEVIQVIKQNLV